MRGNVLSFQWQLLLKLNYGVWAKTIIFHNALCFTHALLLMRNGSKVFLPFMVKSFCARFWQNATLLCVLSRMFTFFQWFNHCITSHNHNCMLFKICHHSWEIWPVITVCNLTITNSMSSPIKSQQTDWQVFSAMLSFFSISFIAFGENGHRESKNSLFEAFLHILHNYMKIFQETVF